MVPASNRGGEGTAGERGGACSSSSSLVDVDGVCEASKSLKCSKLFFVRQKNVNITKAPQPFPV